jgi:anion transporter
VTTLDAKAGERTELAPERRALYLRLAKVAVSFGAPLALWLAPVPIATNTHGALAISAFMILAWMTETMEYASAGLVGLMLFWLFRLATPTVVFSGFVNDTAWFYFGAMLLGAMATKSGLPQRIANFVVGHIGITYSRLLLGLILIDFLLTFIVPSGAACLVIMASIAMGVMTLYEAEKGSNIGRGLFLTITYNTSIFNKMMVAGTASIMARGMIEKTGVEVSWGLWFLAFLPTALVTIAASWWFTLKIYPPEAESLAGRGELLKAHFRNSAPWTPLAIKATCISFAALALWVTDPLHHISASIIAFAAGLFALLPFVDVLNADDVKRVNLMPFFFVASALGLSEVLRVTGGLDLLTGAVIGGIEPLLSGRAISVNALYWGGLLYHLFTASEISMLATSMPILMEFARTHHLDPVFVGIIWSFSSGPKLFAYQSAILVLGYGYGYFRHSDLFKMGLFLSVIEFAVLAVSVLFYWPLLGL